MNFLYCVKLICNFKEFITALKFMYNKKILKNLEHLCLAGNWLLKAQKQNGGYFHSYSLIKGWLNPYPETTGYIIPTMIRLGKILKDDRFIISAKKAGNWLINIQNEDGSFFDLSKKKQVFDTAQIVFGLLELYKENKEERFLNSIIKACDWIVCNQEQDGYWIRFSYNNIPHTYYSKVGAVLLLCGDFIQKSSFLQAGMKNIKWVLNQQLKNSFFNYMSFLDEPPYLHTIIYTLEGLLDSYKIIKDKEIFDKVLLTTERLIELSRRDKILCSQYDKNWQVRNKERCLVGLAQWANLALDIFFINKDKRYYFEAIKNLDYLKTKQITQGSENIKGALAGSFPIWGSYMRFSFPNWAVKYFIDGLLNLIKNEEFNCYTTNY